MVDNLGAGYIVGGVGILLAIGQMAWSKFFSSSGQAEGQLYGQLAEQLKSCLDRIDDVERKLDDERRLRRLAEDRISVLENELARHGLEIPKQ